MPDHPDQNKNVEISSLDSRFSVLDDATALTPLTRSTTIAWAGGPTPGSTELKAATGPIAVAARALSTGRFVSVAITSSAKSATVIYKPTQIAQDERQERMNKIIRHGFVAGARTTTK